MATRVQFDCCRLFLSRSWQKLDRRAAAGPGSLEPAFGFLLSMGASPDIELIKDCEELSSLRRQQIGDAARKRGLRMPPHQARFAKRVEPFRQHFRRNARQCLHQLAIALRSRLQMPEDERVPAMPQKGEPELNNALVRHSRRWLIR